MRDVTVVSPHPGSGSSSEVSEVVRYTGMPMIRVMSDPTAMLCVRYGSPGPRPGDVRCHLKTEVIHCPRFEAHQINIPLG